MAVDRTLDASLKDRIVSPSTDFKAFLNDYFLVWQIYVRGEQDSTVLDRLAGVERETAVAMIVTNLRTGAPHIVQAAVRLGLKHVVPALQAMWRNPAYDGCERFEIAKALYEFGAMTDGQMYSYLAETLRTEVYVVLFGMLDWCYRVFTLGQAQSLTDIALRRNDYSIRADAYRAAVAIHYIRSHGGQFTEELAREIWQKGADAATVGSEQPMFYEQLQYYVGDKVYADKALFEQRIMELWEPDRSKRRMPFFTEINEKGAAR